MNRRFFYLIFLVCFCFSCGERQNYLEDALQLAGNNRPEMEKVLAHYRQNPEDSLKYKAAVFLIENMPGHYSYKHQDHLQAYYDELYNAISLDNDNETNKRIIEEISAKYNDSRVGETVWDIQTITAQYIIDNIEQAFDVWENGEWATHVSFDDFCEYILPYKGGELQALDNWREYARDTLKGDIDLLHYCDLYRNLTFKAATSVSQEIIDLVQQEYPAGGIHSIPIKDIRTLTKMPFGSCADHVFLALPIMRSKGIPVMEDFTPQWPFQASGHSWSVVLDNNGKNLVFSPGTSNPGEPHKPDEKMAKVFRRQYAINREIAAIHLSEQSVPTVFRNLSIKDVTDEYMLTSDVEIEIPSSVKHKHKYAYLAVFNNRNWIPIQYGKISGGKVKFNNMGRNCMYLPVFYDGNMVVPFSSPFYITSLGKVQRYDTDTSQTTTLNIYRKYFIGKHCYDVGDRLKGGKFQVANRADFRDSITIYQIPTYTTQSGEFMIPDETGKYRYWRYLSAEEKYNNMAELYFYQKGNPQTIYGKIIGTSGSCTNDKRYEKYAVFDGDPLTYYDALEHTGSWVGMDFGEAIRIDKISYTPRGDGNDITPGDIHECLYWFDNQWVSLGRRVANDIVLVYEDVPVNTIYWIRNHSRGKEERIFTYENGKQILW